MDAFCNVLSGLLPYGNLTVNLYLISGGITEGMPQVEQIQRVVSRYLKENRLSRVYIHFVHGLQVRTAKDVDYYFQYYYQSWKRSSWGFDREGFLHQEVPRLMLLPVIVPDEETDADELAKLLALLKGAFFLPGLYVGEKTAELLKEEGVTKPAEKIYVGINGAGGLADTVHTLYTEAIVEDLSANLESGIGPLTHPCPPGMVVSAPDGKAYACLDAFIHDRFLLDYLRNPDLDALLLRYRETAAGRRPCVACKEARVEDVARSTLDVGKAREAGALFFRFGASHQEAGDYPGALASFKNSLKLSEDEETPTIQFRIGLCLMNMGRYEEALQAFRSAESTYRDHHYLQFYAALCHYGQGRAAEAIERLSRALELNPPVEDLVRILIYLGTCYNELERYADAVVPLEKAKTVAGDIKEIYSTLGFSYFRLGDYDKAVENLQTAVRIDPGSAIDYASLAANYREKGEIEQAVSMFEKALEIDADLVHARTGLMELRKRL